MRERGTLRLLRISSAQLAVSLGAGFFLFFGSHVFIWPSFLRKFECSLDDARARFVLLQVAGALSHAICPMTSALVGMEGGEKILF